MSEIELSDLTTRFDGYSLAFVRAGNAEDARFWLCSRNIIVA